MEPFSAITNNVEEEKALERFKESVKSLELRSGANNNDMSLMRFLRARDFDLKKAEEMMKTSDDWRMKFEIDSFEFWEHPEEISSQFSVYHTGFDNEGRPVYYAPLGNWGSARDLFGAGLEEDCLKFAAKGMDQVLRQLVKTRHQNFICIVDITGATYRRAFYEFQNFKGIQALIWMFNEYEANYPETLHKAYVINTPSVFFWGFNIVKPLMTKRTLSKINIFDTSDSSWESVIREIIPEESFPELLGGEGKMISLW